RPRFSRHAFRKCLRGCFGPILVTMGALYASRKPVSLAAPQTPPVRGLTFGFASCKHGGMDKHPISVYRATTGLSQEAMAQLVGCKRWMINRIEVGDRFPSRDLLLRIVDVTG